MRLSSLPAVGIPWSVWVWTSDTRDGGTDANVSMQLYGEKGVTEIVGLDNEADNFERGELDKFQVITVLYMNTNTMTTLYRELESWVMGLASVLLLHVVVYLLLHVLVLCYL